MPLPLSMGRLRRCVGRTHRSARVGPRRRVVRGFKTFRTAGSPRSAGLGVTRVRARRTGGRTLRPANSPRGGPARCPSSSPTSLGATTPARGHAREADGEKMQRGGVTRGRVDVERNSVTGCQGAPKTAGLDVGICRPRIILNQTCAATIGIPGLGASARRARLAPWTCPTGGRR